MNTRMVATAAFAFAMGCKTDVNVQNQANQEPTVAIMSPADGTVFAETDAIDFVGWYTHKTNRAVGISKWDPYNQYLAYHEGATGWKRGTYKRKAWLKDTARRVDRRAKEWGAQLARCEDDLDKGWWIFS